MLLPWYVETYVATGKALSIHHRGVSAFGSFSFVEAAVLLVSAFVLGMLFARAEGRAFHLPGGDGSVILGAGAWTALLIFYRLLDTPSTSRHGPQVITDVGLAWGIFIALAVAIALALSGYRVRSAGVSEPPLLRSRPSAPGPAVTDAPTRASTATDSPTRVWAGTPVATASDAPTRASTATDSPTRVWAGTPVATASDAPTRASTASDAPTRASTASDAPTRASTASDAPTRASTASDESTRASPPSDRQPRAS